MTELGPIPSDWEVKRLGEMIEDETASLQTGPFGTVLSASEFVERGHPVISVREIRTGYIQLFNETPCVSGETYKRLSKYTLNPNDLVFARKGSVDRSALIPDGGISYFLGSDGIVVRFNDKSFWPRYILYYLQSETAKKYLIDQAYGTTMAGLNEGIMRSLMLPLPPLPEQHRIAAALSDVDELIGALGKLVEKKRAIKTGAMQRLLTGQTRLPGFGGKWVEKRLGDCGKLVRDMETPLAFPDKQFFEYSMPAFDAGKNAKIIFGKSMLSARTKIQGEVLLFNKLNVRQRRIWYVESCPDNALCSSEFLPYYSDTINLRLLAYILDTEQCTRHFVDISKGTSNSQKRISPQDFEDYRVVLPPTLSEQRAIAAVLSNMDADCGTGGGAGQIHPHQIRHDAGVADGQDEAEGNLIGRLTTMLL